MSNGEKKGKGCGCGCLGVVILALIIVGIAYGCGGGNSNEDEWVNQLIEEKAQAEQLYAQDLPPEEKAAQAREKAQTIQSQYDQICEETGKSQLDYPLLRAYVCVRQMYTSLAYMAENVDYEENSNDYFQANGEAESILRENYE